ncbi:hypothetical protein Nepgr_003982 [Nepenthes gracilis]|uniref:Uncharacterized protein n=1 Tax=Nepenthes gracilis TaxID=150966 RepID=A0AAD3XEH5_NEPGR|nr:hypothetical protein Nepgr_003982 [Nepenthes gracilis]
MLQTLRSHCFRAEASDPVAMPSKLTVWRSISYSVLRFVSAFVEICKQDGSLCLPPGVDKNRMTPPMLLLLFLDWSDSFWATLVIESWGSRRLVKIADSCCVRNPELIHAAGDSGESCEVASAVKTSAPC